MQHKEFTDSFSENLLEQINSILETHMIGKTVIVKGKKGKVIKQVGSDGKTESDEIYQVKFEDGVVEDIPARDMEMQGDISNRKEPSENEAEDIVNEAKYRPTPVSPGSRYPTQQKKTKNTNVHSGIPGMSHKGKETLMTMANIFDTTGGPHLNHQNLHRFTHHGVNQTLKAANKHLEDNPHPRLSKHIALIKKELGESVVKEAKKVRVKTQSGTTERVSPDDLKAAGGVYDRIKRLKLAIADKQHAAHQKKVDKSRIRQDSVEYDGESLDEKAMKSEPPFHGMSAKAWKEAKIRIANKEAKARQEKEKTKMPGILPYTPDQWTQHKKNMENLKKKSGK
jgi:hypothetical protein